jgi:DNA-binding transcriptional MocR family regulator
LLNLKVVGIPMDRYGIVPDEFESACRSRRGKALYTIPTIHNPTATTLSRTRRKAIARIAERYAVAIIEDPVHHLLADDPPPPLSCYAPENSFFIAGMSKVVTGGLRTAFLITPPRWLDAMVQGVWATAWMTSPLCAEITTMWIKDGTADATVERKRKESAARVELAREKLPERSLTAARCGYHAWLRLPEHWDSAAFANEARRRGAAVTASAWFVAAGEEAPRAVRLSLSAPRTREAVANGLDVVAGLLAESPGTGPPII